MNGRLEKHSYAALTDKKRYANINIPTVGRYIIIIQKYIRMAAAYESCEDGVRAAE